jgi:hypothetical protein
MNAGFSVPILQILSNVNAVRRYRGERLPLEVMRAIAPRQLLGLILGVNGGPFLSATNAGALDRKPRQKTPEDGNAVYNVICLRVKTETLEINRCRALLSECFHYS